MRTPTGSATKSGTKWVARMTWTDAAGRRHDRREQCASKNAALDRLNTWRLQWQETGAIRREKRTTSNAVKARTFNELADHFEERYAKPAEYAAGKKVAGMRAWATSRGHVTSLRKLLGSMPLSEIGWPELDDARQALLRAKSRHGRKLSIAYVNRVMSTCRRMFAIARQRDWMDRDPFAKGDPLIERAFERPRERIMTRDEEARILRACKGGNAKRTHLRYVIITAVETGMRRGEVLQLQRKAGVLSADGYELSWVDWEKRIIHVTEFHTKDQRGRRLVPMSSRLYRRLSWWMTQLSPRTNAVFGVAHITRSWASACRLAGVQGLRIHDLRHTATTRMVEAGIPEPLVSKIVGHKVEGPTEKAASMTRRYINQYEAGVLDQVAKLDQRRQKQALRN